MMDRPGVGLLAMVLVLGVLALHRQAPLAALPSNRGSATAASTAERSATREADIAFYRARMARDPYGARDRAALAGLYLARGRDLGDPSDIGRAESLATASLRTRHQRNQDAVRVLTSALMAEHRFLDARTVLRREADLNDPVSRATLGEIDLELGQYTEADSLFQSLALVRTTAPVAPRYARWLEVNGHSGAARELLALARSGLEEGFRVPPEQLAWFDLRLGELAQRNGRYDLADAAYRRGLGLVPDDARLLAASARLAAARQNWARAITLGEEALAGAFEPGILGLLSEARSATGDSAAAAEYARAMEVSLSRQPGAYHRGWALFLLDHQRQVDRVLARAREELALRRDIYGYDVVAWALHQSGQDRLARGLSDSALARGTRDPMLHYHRGVIALALGDTVAARDELRRTLAIDPWYRPGHGPSAADLLTPLAPR